MYSVLKGCLIKYKKVDSYSNWEKILAKPI